MHTIYRHLIESIPNTLRDSRIAQARVVFAVITLVMVLMQMFSFERFPDVLAQYWLFTTALATQFGAVLLLLLEIGSIPYLIGLATGSRTHALSRASSVLAWACWFLLMCWGMGQATRPSKAPLLGDTIPIGFNLGVVVMVGLLLVAVVLLAYGRRLQRLLEMPSQK